MASDDGLSPGDILKALGLKLPSTQANPLRDLWNDLREAVDFATFNSDVQGLSSWGAFETYLQDDLGFSASDAADLRNQLEQKYSSFSDFQTELDSFSSFDEWENSLSWGETTGGESTDEDGRLVTGIRFFDEPGITRDDVSVPAGSVEIFGREIHTSQTGAPSDEESSSSLFAWSGMSADPSSPDVYETVTFSATVENTGTDPQQIVAALSVDGERVDESELVKLAPGSTREFSFLYEFEESGTYSVRIGESATIDVSAVPPNL